MKTSDIITTAYVAASVDGYIADVEGGVDWLNAVPNPDGSDYGFGQFMDEIDAVLMGGNTFRVVQSFGEWPYTKPVYVISRRISAPPPGYEDRIQLASGRITDVLNHIADAAGPHIYVDGGNVIQGALAEGRLNRLIVTTVPIVLGNGIPLFARPGQPHRLRHVKSEVLGAGMVKTTYDVIQSAARG